MRLSSSSFNIHSFSPSFRHISYFFTRKVNCGGRAAKVGLLVDDEIVGVNNLEIDNHPLTLGSALNSENQIIGECVIH